MNLTSGHRFRVTYELRGTASSVEEQARLLAVEQTIEFPPAFVDDVRILAEVVGQIETIRQVEGRVFHVVVGYAEETASGEFTQFLNVLFGNISLQEGIRIVGLDLSDVAVPWWKGPRFGVEGLRRRVGVPHRAMLCTAVKPMGLSAEAMGELAGQFALGGVDFVKDDHGLANQTFAPYRERWLRCLDGIHRANARTGRSCGFVANVTAPRHELEARAMLAKELGAAAVMVAPGIVGLDVLGHLSGLPGLDLPVVSHPAMLGALSSNPTHGIAHDVLFGTLNRLAGADAAIFPSFGGRFSPTKEICGSVAGACRSPGPLRACLPAPGGGIRIEQVREAVRFYGRDVVLLIGGDLHSGSAGIPQTCAAVVERLEDEYSGREN
jgi:ribulose-bisphosphate carboxylase large chain